MIIYIVARGDSISGGSESLHQAASMLRQKGFDARMHYVEPEVTEGPQKFSGYEVRVSEYISDDEHNVLVVPETLTYFLHSFKRIRKVIWWLSVDFYEQYNAHEYINRRLKERNWPSICWPVQWLGSYLKGSPELISYNFKDRGEYLHLYNCEYAYQYITAQGVVPEKTMYICGPINQEFFEVADADKRTKKENIVLYNPQKGGQFTDKIINRAKEQKVNAQFVAIHDMSTDDVAALMKRAKIYIDFGFFPGPERIPREAVLMGCNIITSMKGSAANSIDVPIPMEFKFEDNDENIECIITVIKDMLQYYEKYYPSFESYRHKVRDQVTLFEESICKFAEYFIR